ncbi:MAG: dihydroxy-acid dehydratase [Gemmataceae bacterium]
MGDSRRTRGLCVARPCRPEAWVGGPIAFIKDGDIITIDSDKKELSVALQRIRMGEAQAVEEARPPRNPWRPRQIRPNRA